jgi:uncharacterized protein (TIGR01777 family)
MRVVVSGASGLIGSALVGALRNSGQDVHRLVRRAASQPDESSWDPAAARLDPGVFAGADAVVHLSGAGIGDRRWTPEYQRLLRASRIESTALLAGTLARLEQGPRRLLCASATGFYGDTGEATVDESAPQGGGFLAGLVADWEAAAEPARRSGLQVTHLRSGIVLSTEGGALGRALTPFRLGLGGRLGSGRQWMSWIALADEVRAIRFLLGAELDGPVNLTAPVPVRNLEYTRALGRAMRRPALMRVPATALRLRFGGLADDILGSQRVLPARLESAGFDFAYPDVDAALRALL